MTPENPLTGGTALRIPAINSPNFNLQNPAASPQPSWAILQSGLAYFFGLTITGGTIVGPDYIINTSGAFFYNGTPAAGNLIYSIASTSGTDGFTNAYQAGATSYDASGNYAQVDGAALEFFTSAAPGLVGLQVSDTDVLTVVGTPGVASFQVTVPISQPLHAADPVAGFGTAETWHAMTLDAGWSLNGSYAAPSYRLLPDGNLQLTGLADFGAGTAANHNLNNANPLPAAYRPVTQKVFRSQDLNTLRGGVQILPSGVIEFLSSSATLRYCEIDAVLPLNL